MKAPKSAYKACSGSLAPLKLAEPALFHLQMFHAERMVARLAAPLPRLIDSTLPDVLPASITREN
jgi:hypothetical protein